MAFWILAALLGLVLSLYYCLTSKYGYWKSCGVEGEEPSILFGSIRDVVFGKMCINGYFIHTYNKWKNEPFFGIYLFRNPYLVVNDVDILQDIMIKNFDVFGDRGLVAFSNRELDAHLVFLESKRWRPLRHKLSPLFSARNIKEMFGVTVEYVNNLDKYLMETIGDSKDSMIIDCRGIAARFVIDVLGAWAFGLETNALSRKENDYYQIGRRAFDHNFQTCLPTLLKIFDAGLYKAFCAYFVPNDVQVFFIKIMLETIDHRKKKNVVKKDTIDLLMALKDNPDLMPEIEATDKFLASQLFIFYTAGFETSATTLSNVLYELSLHQELQDKLRSEINDEMKRTGGVINYYGIQNLEFLKMVLQETLRLYPAVPYTMRRAEADFTLNSLSTNKSLKIKKGQGIIIPINAIHRDEKYFPDPNTFKPERFTGDTSKLESSASYMPFGSGPRTCIGKRFALSMIKVAVVKLLQNYRFEPCEKTHIPYLPSPRAVLLSPANGLHLRVTKLVKSVS